MVLEVTALIHIRTSTPVSKPIDTQKKEDYLHMYLTYMSIFD